MVERKLWVEKKIKSSSHDISYKDGVATLFPKKQLKISRLIQKHKFCKEVKLPKTTNAFIIGIIGNSFSDKSFLARNLDIRFSHKQSDIDAVDLTVTPEGIVVLDTSEIENYKKRISLTSFILDVCHLVVVVSNEIDRDLWDHIAESKGALNNCSKSKSIDWSDIDPNSLKIPSSPEPAILYLIKTNITKVDETFVKEIEDILPLKGNVLEELSQESLPKSKSANLFFLPNDDTEGPTRLETGIKDIIHRIKSCSGKSSDPITHSISEKDWMELANSSWNICSTLAIK